MAGLGHLLTSQVDTLVQEARAQGFRKRDFQWESTEAARAVPRIGQALDHVQVTHMATGFRFTFIYQRQSTADPRPGAEQRRHHVKFSPGEGVREEEHYNQDWSGALHFFEKWLRCLRREIDSPDYLSQAEDHRRRLLSAGGVFDSEESFTPEEQAALHSELEKMKEELASVRLFSEEEIQAIKLRLDELDADLAGMQKWKWATLAIGVPFRIQALMNFDADQFQELFSRVVGLVSDLPTLLPPG